MALDKARQLLGIQAVVAEFIVGLGLERIFELAVAAEFAPL